MAQITENKIRELEEIARQLRLTSLEMIYRRKAGHPGGSLSAADIVATLFFHAMRVDPQDPNWPERDRFILSKGHASALLYAALSHRGYFPRQDLMGWGDLDCHLQGHPDRIKTLGVEMTTGVLGHGIAIGAGMALAARLDKKGYRVYVLLGDGECQAGVIWEGVMTAAKYRLDNLLAIVDYNNVQLDGSVHEIMPMEPMVEKWRAFNWAVLEINGHDIYQIATALNSAEQNHAQPTVIIAHTTKGRGVSYMENQAYWHGVPPNDAQYAQAIEELRSEEVIPC